MTKLTALSILRLMYPRHEGDEPVAEYLRNQIGMDELRMLFGKFSLNLNFLREPKHIGSLFVVETEALQPGIFDIWKNSAEILPLVFPDVVSIDVDGEMFKLIKGFSPRNLQGRYCPKKKSLVVPYEFFEIETVDEFTWRVSKPERESTTGSIWGIFDSRTKEFTPE